MFHVIFCTQLVTKRLFRGVVVPFLFLCCKMIKKNVSLIAKIDVNKVIKLRCANAYHYCQLIVTSIAFRRGAGFRCFNP